MSIDELVYKIHDIAEHIKDINPDNIQQYEYDAEKRRFIYRIYDDVIEESIEATDIAHELITKYNVPCYASYEGEDTFCEYFIDVLKATSENEFIEALKKYIEELEGWCNREYLFYDDVR